MRRTLVSLGVAAFLGLSVAGHLFACGDKYLVIGRGTRFQRAARAHVSASILVFANPASPLPKAFSDAAAESVLHKAGHRSASVTNIKELDRALREGTFDLVFADIGDTDVVSARVPQGVEAPVLVPVIYNATGDEVKQAKRHYACILKAPGRSDSLLDVIDDALAIRAKARSKINDSHRSKH
jgi:hypothetical protein